MNFVMARRKALVVHSHFSEAADYFTLYKKRNGTRFAVCSEPFPGDSGWKAQPNNHLEVISF